jgi:hypothetical protein
MILPICLLFFRINFFGYSAQQDFFNSLRPVGSPGLQIFSILRTISWEPVNRIQVVTNEAPPMRGNDPNPHRAQNGTDLKNQTRGLKILSCLL